MRNLVIVLLLATVSVAAIAQPIPIPEVAEPSGYYVFTVYTPSSAQESAIWKFGTAELTTHRLRDAADSTDLSLTVASHASLRTYFTTNVGADAGARPPLPRSGAEGTGTSINELLTYPVLLSPEQRQLTESYLAIKHGLTLDQQRPVNYLALANDGSAYPVWTATAAAAFRHRIIGLAVDTLAHLQRLSGHSVLAPGLLELSWSQAPAATAYLLVADNGKPTARVETSYNSWAPTPLHRRWRVERTGPIPPTTIRINPYQLYARKQVGEHWGLRIKSTTLDTIHYAATDATEGAILFPDIVFPTDRSFELELVLVSTLREARIAPSAPLQFNPNPISAGQVGQLRAQFKDPTALSLLVYDVTGRVVSEQRLPMGTHHLTEVTFPAPGTYTLRLRPRLSDNRTSTQSLKVIVQ